MLSATSSTKRESHLPRDHNRTPNLRIPLVFGFLSSSTIKRGISMAAALEPIATVRGQRKLLLRITKSSGWLSRSSPLPLPEIMNSFSPTTSSMIRQLPSFDISLFKLLERSAHPLSLPTPIIQVPLVANSHSFVISIVVGCNDRIDLWP